MRSHEDNMIRALVLALAVSVAAVSAANAQPSPPYDTSNSYGLSNAGVPPGPYLKLGGGYSMGATSRFDNSYVAGAGLGYRFLPFFRSDITFDYRGDFHDKAFGDAKFKNWSAMANGYFDFNLPFLRPLIPYIGGGVGIAQNKVDGTTVTVTGGQVNSITGSNKDQFAWQAMAGASFYFNPTLALDVGYRYFHGGKAEGGAVTGFPSRTGDFNTHEIIGALRFGF
jgi:opacity protein-like surface antigen